MKYYKKINGRKYHYNEGEIIKGDVLEILFVNDSNYMNDWQEVTEKDYLLQEARKRYPKGTEFRTPTQRIIYTSSGNFQYADGVIHNMVIVFDGDRCSQGIIYYKGQWAEINRT